MVATLPDDLCTVPPYREYFVGHSLHHMEQRMHAVAEAEATAQAIVKEKSRMTQEANYASDDDDDYPAGSSGEGFLDHLKGNMSCPLHAGILKFVE
eukprot:10599110-Ditylum_brightwellii.AAC.1